MSKSIFISHSSADEPLVQKLVDSILGNGCEVSKSDIFCTTLPGMKIPAGTRNYIEAIRQEAEHPKLFILVISPNYLESKFCLCELGAAWASGLPLFPFVVPPLKKSEVRVTLAVTQSGLIDDSDFLDEFRDKVKEFHTTSVTTGAWNAAKQAFLKALPDIIDSLPEPQKVDKSLLDKAQQDFVEATDEIARRDTTIEKLTAQIAALEKVKDKAGVAKVRAEHSDDAVELANLIKEAKRALKKLQSATPYVLFCDSKGDPAIFNSSWSPQVDRALDSNEIRYADPGFKPNFDKSKVAEASEAVDALRGFIRDGDHQEAITDFQEEEEVELDLRDFGCWRKLFHVSDPT
ncbi:MAG: TIR domain-containing protein [Verrucomicrobiaceae bacterium]|nr:TIR domain-containing protein [Verrucomicrobiaceae bacterium]